MQADQSNAIKTIRPQQRIESKSAHQPLIALTTDKLPIENDDWNKLITT